MLLVATYCSVMKKKKMMSGQNTLIQQTILLDF